jgi:hypothetical protein
MIRNCASLSNTHKSMNNWMHYVKKESTKYNNNAGNSVQGKKTGHQKLDYWESESYSGSWHVIGHTGPRFKTGFTQLFNKANEAKLQQTADTPFMTGALQEDVGWLGIGPSACMMLDGTYEPPDEVEEYTKNLIKQFQKNRKATEGYPSYKISPEEWKSF